jgi:hypothetical protein
MLAQGNFEILEPAWLPVSVTARSNHGLVRVRDRFRVLTQALSKIFHIAGSRRIANQSKEKVRNPDLRFGTSHRILFPGESRLLVLKTLDPLVLRYQVKGLARSARQGSEEKKDCEERSHILTSSIQAAFKQLQALTRLK